MRAVLDRRRLAVGQQPCRPPARRRARARPAAGARCARNAFSRVEDRADRAQRVQLGPRGRLGGLADGSQAAHLLAGRRYRAPRTRGPSRPASRARSATGSSSSVERTVQLGPPAAAAGSISRPLRRARASPRPRTAAWPLRARSRAARARGRRRRSRARARSPLEPWRLGRWVLAGGALDVVVAAPGRWPLGATEIRAAMLRASSLAGRRAGSARVWAAAAAPGPRCRSGIRA